MQRILIFMIFLIIVLMAGYYWYPYNKMPVDVTIDSIVVKKSEHTLSAYSKSRMIKTYTVSLGKGGKGMKQFEGDEKTPVGIYIINSKNPNSDFHRNLGISYPSIQDIQAATRLGKNAGGDIKIHGLKNGQRLIGKFQRWRDWTNGCIALTDEEIDDLYVHTPLGTPILIIP